jgi:phospholipase C
VLSSVLTVVAVGVVQVVGTPKGPEATSQYDHTSVISTVNSLLGVTEAPLTKRAAWSGNFDYLLSQRSTPRTVCAVCAAPVTV